MSLKRRFSFILAILVTCLLMPQTALASEAVNFDCDHFMKYLRNDFYSNWSPPPKSGGDPGHTAVIFLALDKNGNLSELKVHKSSSFAAYDQAACDAVRASAPILPRPVLPAKLEPLCIEFTFSTIDMAKYFKLRENQKDQERKENEKWPKVTREMADKAVVDANALFESGKLDEAAEVLRKALSIDEVNRQAQLLYARILYKKAMACKLEEQKVSLLRESLRCKSSFGKSRAALYSCLRSSGIDPLSVVQRVALARKFQSEGNLKDAEVEMQEILRIDDKDPAAVKARIALQSSLAQEKELERWKQVVSRTDSVEAHAGLAKAYENSGDIVHAIAEYKCALEKNPNDPFSLAALKRLQEAAIKPDVH